MEKRTFVGIAEMKFSSQENELLVAPNLGSCLGVAVFDPKTGLAGLIHCLLPMSKSDPNKAKASPCTYVDTGVSLLFQEFFSRGSKKRDLVVTVAGGAVMGEQLDHFQIGQKNFTVFRKLLWKNSVPLKADHVGGKVARTISISPKSGEVWVKAGSENVQLA